MELVSVIFVVSLCSFVIGFVWGGETEYKSNLAAKDPYIYHNEQGWWVRDCPFKQPLASREKARQHAKYHKTDWIKWGVTPVLEDLIK